MFRQFANPRPSTGMAQTVWVCGVAATALLWAVIAGAIGLASHRPVAVATDMGLLAPFLLFATGWTGAWLHTRRRPPAPTTR
jgi:hypothetical protein